MQQRRRREQVEVHPDELGGWTAARAAARTTRDDGRQRKTGEASEVGNEVLSASCVNGKSEGMAARFWSKYDYDEPYSPECDTTMTGLMEDFEEVESNVERVSKRPMEIDFDVGEIGSLIKNWQRTKSAANGLQANPGQDVSSTPERVAAAKLARKEQEWSAIEDFQSTSRFRGRRLKKMFGMWSSLYKAVVYHRLQTLSGCFSKLYIYQQTRARKADTRAMCDAHFLNMSTSRWLRRWRHVWEDKRLAQAANEIAVAHDFNRRGHMVLQWWLEHTRNALRVKQATMHWERHVYTSAIRCLSANVQRGVVYRRQCEDAAYYYRLNLSLKCMSSWRRFLRSCREERSSSKRFVFNTWEEFVCGRHSQRARFDFALKSMERFLLRRSLHEWWRSR
jgi:hypothetical protein